MKYDKIYKIGNIDNGLSRFEEPVEKMIYEDGSDIEIQYESIANTTSTAFVIYALLVVS